MLLEDKEEQSWMKDIVDAYPMSDIQQGMVYYGLHEAEHAVYHDQMIYQLQDSSFNIDAFQQALEMLAEKHEILRTGFQIADYDVSMQIVYRKVPIHVEMFNIQHLSQEEQSQWIDRYLEEDRKNLFVVEQAPLWRANVIKLGENDVAIALITHHAILDGWSVASFMTELAQVYFRLKKGESFTLPLLKSNYKDYILEQMLLSEEEEMASYWEEELQDYKRLSLPWDKNIYSFKEVALDAELFTQLKRVAHAEQVSMKTICLAAYISMINMMSYEYDLTIGLVENARPVIEDAEQVLGCFLNSVPFRIEISEQDTWKRLIDKVNKKQIELKTYGRYPLRKVAEVCNEQVNAAINPFFDVLFNYVDFHVYEQMQEGKFELGKKGYVRTNTRLDFSISVTLSEFSIKVYSELSEQILDRMIDYYRNSLTAIVKNRDGKIEKQALMSEEERRHLLFTLNDTRVPYEKEKTVQELFEEQVLRVPDQTAVVFENQRLSYKELNEKSNQLARVLRIKGVTKESIVGVLVERSAEMIIGILAIIKAGGAYVPIDPQHPKDRILYMLNDCGTNVLLTQHRLMKQIEEFKGIAIDIEDANNYHSDTSNLELINNSDNLAYVIYTSGTTGNPKGAAVEHKNVANLVKAITSIGNFKSSKSILVLTSISFDVFVSETLLFLTQGTSLFVANEQQHKDPKMMKKLIESNQIEMLQITPSRMQLILQNVEAAHSLKTVKNILFGGEVLTTQLVMEVQKYTSANLYNGYGPSEAAVYTTIHHVEDPEYITIGKPVANVNLYVISKNGQLQPMGIPGELCVAGAGLGRGYVNRPELTRERYIKNPYSSLYDRMYKTGDLVRLLPDGNVEYLGRIDHQVKIRGYRIELGEIEARLLEQTEVREVVLIAYKDAVEHDYLCAYWAGSEQVTASELRKRLARKLPSYMIPSYFVQMDQLPVTVNGKVDRRALPKPERKYSGTDYVAPRTPTEKKLAEIWSSVLGIEQIGAQDHFFDIGGHSLKAMMLVSRIHKEFQVEFPLKEIFAYPTLEELARYIEGGRERAYTAIEPAAEQPYYPLSSAQKRLYLVREIEGEGVSYNMPVALRVEGPLELKQLHQAFQALVNRHEVLRTSFALQDGELVQQIHSSVEVPYLVQKVSSETEVREHIQAFIRPFDLQQAPLFRAGVLQLATEEHIVLWDTHHIISDGLSSVVLQQELVRLYEGESLEAPVLQYKDYAVWEQEQLHSGAMEAAGEYWKAQFAGEVPILDFPTDYTRPAIQQFAGDYVSFELSEELSQRLIELSKMQGVTLYMTLLAAYQVLLSKYTGQEDIVVGTPVAGRPQAELEKTVGMFVHTLALRSMPAGEKSFSAYLSEVKEQVLQAFVHQAYPLEELVEHVSVQRDLSRNPLFDTVFVLQNFERQAMEVPGLKLTPYAHDFKIAKFDLTLQMIERGTHLGGQIEYSSHLFRAETMERLTHHWMQLLEAIVEQPGSLINELEIVTAAEKEQLLHAFNDTKTTYPAEKTIVQLFEEQVSRTPEQVAVVYEEESVTYDELNQRANQLARVLVGKGVGPEKIVGILVDRSVEMIVGILGILKAGGAYLPIDPAYPEDRIEFMLNDSGTKVLLTQGHLPGAQAFRGEVIDLMDRGLYEGEADALPVQYAPDHLAYIIYTSGSTGTPKGVMVEHRNVVRLLCNDNNRFDFSEQDVWTMFHSYCFDFSVWEMYGALLYGGKLVVVPSLVAKDPRAFVTLLSKQQVTILNQTPTSFYQVSTVACSEGAAPLRVRKVIFGGEALSPIHLKPWKEKYPETQLINMYGITETTVHVTYKEITAREIEKNESNIGQPIPTLEVYVLNEQGNLAPIGIPGEMYVSGDGITRGYLNREDLTAQRFISNPFVAGKRMYKTGDAARWLPDGNLEYIGRIDNQVKIRGYRIEPSEIAEQLLTHEQVTEAEVIARKTEEGNAYLCAYVVSAQPEIVLELRSYLAQKLPDYMIPAYFMQLEKFPVTANGKLDTKSLPAPEGNVLKRAEYVAPRNEVEEILAGIWKEVLNDFVVGINDNFFELGGDSIKAIQISARLHKLKLVLETKHLFLNPTIGEVSRYVRQLEASIDQGVVEGAVELTPIQNWFFENVSVDRHHFNQSMMIYKKDGFDLQALHAVLQKLVEHHDALRMRFVVKGNNQIHQTNTSLQGEHYQIHIIQISDDEEGKTQIEREAELLQQQLNIEQGPLVQLGVFQFNNGEEHLLFIAHHLVVDGVSWRILLEDFVEGYEQFINHQPIKFSNKTHSYQQWSQALKEYAKSKKMLEESNYWNQIERFECKPLPKDSEVYTNTWGESQTVHILFSEKETAAILKEIHHVYRTEINDILLTGLVLAIQQWSGINRCLISLEGHGREEIIKGMNITRTVGWFTSIFPVALEIQEDKDISTHIKQVKETLRKIPNKGIGYGILKYLSNENGQQYVTGVQPEISFNYLGQFDDERKTKFYSFSDMPRGKDISSRITRTHNLEVNGIVRKGQLRLSVTVNSQQYYKETILHLLGLYKAALLNISEHCLGKEEVERTPSDFSAKDLNIEELDLMFDMLKNLN
ncbi:amino acid adenylation domain-containing protein [Paenibacillus silvae]|uniref:non-ribosomal peptide synthetase n=2 Tax=Paenibacillus TaxID=44249 RepID=UPI0025A05438|nr:non-ribosomal peptide synthetase [Paenibacillus silvae]MDM5281496.1 amino acid adenylation domain-containing protein [Paenibacillus silvae]